MSKEQPGDQEDRQGAPFVGPAGAVLDDALRDAGGVPSEYRRKSYDDFVADLTTVAKLLD